MASEFLNENPINQYPLKLRDMEVLIYISNAQLELYKSIAANIDKSEMGGFFSTCSLEELARYEKMINITAKANETVEFRRVRLQNRFNLNRQFTMRLFCEKFNEIVGYGNWAALLNSERTLLIISTDEVEVMWTNELMETIDLMKPVTLNVVITPISIETMLISNHVGQREMQYSFKVGVSKVGVDTLGELITEEQEVEAEMITNNELSKTANYIKDQIGAVRINNSINITHFTAKTVSDNELTVEYVVPVSVGTITKIEILDTTDNTIIAEQDVEIETNNNVLMVHKIRVQEGTNNE